MVLEGKAQLKCQRDGQEVELKAEKLSLRLSASGVVPVREQTAPTTEPPVPNGKTKTSATTVPVIDQASGGVPVIDREVVPAASISRDYGVVPVTTSPKVQD